VVVTDLRRDYGGDIARVFPQASHHECIFHALQDAGRTCRQFYGSDYAQTWPEVEAWRLDIGQIFQAKTKMSQTDYAYPPFPIFHPFYGIILSQSQ
jgi:hypothetical protein